MDDQAFLNAFEAGRLPPIEFGHRGHIRMLRLGQEDDVALGDQLRALAHSPHQRLELLVGHAV